MISIKNNRTIRTVFYKSVKKYRKNIFISSLRLKPYQKKIEYTYDEVFIEVEKIKNVYLRAGYGVGDRIALMIGNNPVHFFHKLGLNIIGSSVVPINPELNIKEANYILTHSGANLIICSPENLNMTAPQ